jgi:hypothetical protein
VHVEADEGHGKESLAIAERYIAEDPAGVLAGAERASGLWMDIMSAAFDDRVELPPLAAAVRGA